MRVAPLVAVALLAPTLAFVAPADPAAAQAQGPEWWNTDWSFRVIAEENRAPDLPEINGQSSNLRSYELNFEEALDEAGWPSSLGTAPSPESIVVVPYSSLSAGAAAGDPIPVTVTDPVSRTGTCDDSSTSRCLVTWEKVDGAKGYGIYWAPASSDLTSPAEGEGPDIVGNGFGHEHYAVLDGYDETQVLISLTGGLSVDSDNIQITSRTPSGTQQVSPTGSECEEGDGVLICDVPAGQVRVITSRPTTVVVNQDDPHGDRVLPLVGVSGQTGNELHASLPERWTDAANRELVLWADEGACAQGCNVDVSPAGQTVTVSPSAAQTVELSDPPVSKAIIATVSSGDGPIHAALRGTGFAPIEARNAEHTNTWLPTAKNGGAVTVEVPEIASVDLNDISRGEQIQQDREVKPPLRTITLPPKTQTLEVISDTPMDVFAGARDGNGAQVHQPITARERIPVPSDAQLLAVAPQLGGATQTVELDRITGTEPSSDLLRLSARATRQVVAADKPTLVEVDTNAPVGFLIRSTGDDLGPLLGQAVPVHHPASVGFKSAGYVEKAIDVTVTPESTFAGSGSVVSFNVSVTNLARTASGATPSLTVDLSLDPLGDAEGNLSTTLEQSTVQVPGEPGATRKVSLSVRVADGLSDVVLPLQVNGTVRDAEDLTASTKTRISVVTIRDFQLTYQDGSTEQTATAEQGEDAVTFDLQVQNTGTVATSIQLNKDTFGGDDFETCLALASGSCKDEVIVEDIEPGRSREVELRVKPPDKEGEDRLEVTVRGQLAKHSGPIRTVDATVFLGVPVGAKITPSTDSIALSPGESETITLNVENQGIQTDATLRVPPSGQDVNATLVNPETGETNTTLSTLLGPRDTQAATWEVDMEVSVGEDAPPGLKTEKRVELELEPSGGIERRSVSTAIPVRIIRVLNNEPLNAPTIPAGVETDVRVPVQTPSLADSTVDVRLLDAPPLWNIDPPGNLTFDSEGQTVLSFTAQPPPREKPGNASVVFSVIDPLGPGGELPVNLGVARGGQADVSTDPTVQVALGGKAVIPIDVHNVGNAPLSGTVELVGSQNVTLTSPPLPALPPGNGTIELPGTITATSPFRGQVELRVLDGNRPAGNTTFDVRAAQAPISLSENRIVPSENPKAGEPYPVTVTVNNAGPVPVRNLSVALLEKDTIVAERAIERLPANGNATVTIEWLPDHDAERSDLSVRADPEGRLVQDSSDDSISLDDANETPGPGLLLVLISLAVPSSIRGFWSLMSRRERWLLVGGIVFLLVLIPALFVPAISVTPEPTNPAPPEDVVDTDDDGVSDTAEITRYGTNPRVSDSDNDTIPDGWEAQHAQFNETFRVFRPDPGRADASEDPDRDALANLGEFDNGTDPHSSDTDDDGFPDGYEVRSGLNPLAGTDGEADCDGDGLTNDREFELGTRSCEADSDGDGIPDPSELRGNWEYESETFEFASTEPTKASTGGSGSPDGWLLIHDLDPHSPDHQTNDPDDDRLSTTREWRFMANRGLTDPADWADGLDPTQPDTDGDGLPDGWEIRNGLDPLDGEDGTVDTDDDGLSNGREFQAGTNPSEQDTDGDGLLDGEEVEGYTVTITKGSSDPEEIEVQSNPLIRDTDGDGLDDLAEREGQADGRDFPPTNPLSGDTDGDGLGDRREVFVLEPPSTLDPTTSDTDGDGLPDGDEFDVWNDLAGDAQTDASFASRIRQQTAGQVDNASALLIPSGDLDGDGTANILDANSDNPDDQDLARTKRDTLSDGTEVQPPLRSGRTLPSSSPALRDTDGDSLPDSWEIRHTQFSSDLGGWLLDPNRADSDGDGVKDPDEDMEDGCYSGQETGDGPDWFDFAYTNKQELERETDPLECDTDDDGLPDGWEVAVINRASQRGVPVDLSVKQKDDPAKASPVPVPGDDATLYVDHPACKDSRTAKGVCLYRWGDGVPQKKIETRRTNATFVEEASTCTLGSPARCTVIRATLALGHEVSLKTDPTLADTDGDGYTDAWEQLHGLTPTDPASPRKDSLDNDPRPGPENGDSLTMREEYEAGTDPFNWDTDKNGEGLADGVDINPLDPTDDKGDCDWDGIPDNEEATGGATDAGVPDTDHDGLLDDEYAPGGCTDADGNVVSTPTPGVDLIAVPNPNEDPDDPTDDFYGETRFGTQAHVWETGNDDLPDGWKALYDLDPAGSHATADTDGDGIKDGDEYELGRPSWWQERAPTDEGRDYGSWWFGSNPRSSSDRDLDNDGLDDGLFDPQPLSPGNDCSLPSTWDLPPAWDRSYCLDEKPGEDEIDTVLRGLRQLAYEHVLTVDEPEPLRATDSSTSSVSVRTKSLDVSPNTISTNDTIDVSVPLCANQGGSCSTPSSDAPLVGVYAVTERGAEPNPKEDPLLCVIDPNDGGDPWVADTQSDGLAHTTGTACPMQPGQRTLANDTDPLILVPHAHGTLRSGESWTVQPDDLQPGTELRLAVWPLPTETGGNQYVADRIHENTPVVEAKTPEGVSKITLKGDPILEAGQSKTVTIELTDTAGYLLPNRQLDVSWNGSKATKELVGDDATLSYTLEAIDTNKPTSIPLTVAFSGAGVVEGTERAFELPVRVESRLSLSVDSGTAPGNLPVEVALENKQGTPLADRSVQASVQLPGDSGTASANATTGSDGNATISVPLPAGTDPGQAKVSASFAGDTEAAPSSAESLADVQVRPTLTLNAPSKAKLTDGVPVTVNLTLPNGDPVTPAPGEAFELVFTLGSVTTERTIVSAPPDGQVEHSFPAGPELPLGNADLEVQLREGRFNPPVSASSSVKIQSGVDVTLEPTVFGVGVENRVTTTVRDALGRPVADAEVTVSVRNTTGTARTKTDGKTDLIVDLPLSASRGQTTAEVAVAGTNSTLPKVKDVPARVRMGTEFDLSGNVSGPVDGFNLNGRLVTATGEGVGEALVHIEGLAPLDVVTNQDGTFSATLAPPAGTDPGNHTLDLSFDGKGTLAPARTEVPATLFSPVNITVEDPPLVPLGGQARVTGTVQSLGEPVENGRVKLLVGNQTGTTRTDSEGRFEVSTPLPADEAGKVPASIVFPGQSDLARGEQPITIRAVEPVSLTATQDTSGEGVTVTVQAASQDGEPISGQTVVAVLPSGPVQLTTNENGVAQYHLAEDTVQSGTQVDFVFKGTETQAPASTTVEIQSQGAALSGAPVGIALIVLVLLVEAIVLWRVYKRRQVVDTVVQAVQDLEDRLRAGDELRASIVQTFRRIQNGLEELGHEEASWETHREFLERSFDDIGRDVPQLGPFMELLDRAQYSAEPMQPNDRVRALELSQGLIEELVTSVERGDAQ